MTGPVAIVKQWLCPHVHTHERDWPLWRAWRVSRCVHCHKEMERPRVTVGSIHPDSGD